MAVCRSRDYRSTLKEVHSSLPPERSRRSRKTLTAFALAMAVTGGTVFSGMVVSDSGEEPARVQAASEPVTAETLAQDEGQHVEVEEAIEKAKEKAKEPLPDFSKMSTSQLQAWAVRVQSEFVMASMAYTEAQTQTAQAVAEADAAAAVAKVATKKADASQEQLTDYVVRSSQDPLLTNPVLTVLTQGEDDPGAVMEEYTRAKQYTDIQADVTAGFIEDREEAEALSKEADALRADAEEQEKEAADLLADIEERASKVAEATDDLFGADAGDVFAAAEQAARNKAAKKNWKEYLASLETAGVTPPPAKALRDPKSLPEGLDPLVNTDGKAVTGVATVTASDKETVTVLPKETVKAVSSAFKHLDEPFVENMSGPDGFDCVGVATASWKKAGVRVAGGDPVDVYRKTRKVSVDSMQVGDLAFFSDSTGVQHMGINLGGNMMLTSDASSMRVGVQQFPGEPFAATRVTLQAKKAANKAPDTERDSYTRCAGEDPGGAGAKMAYPIKEGSYRMSASFGQGGDMWKHKHTGQDFAADPGTPVTAAKGGKVTVTSSPWAGPNFVTVDHGDGLMTTYGHMRAALVSTGDVVKAGQVVGEVGNEGNSTGPHLHFEVVVDGVKVDPMLFLSSESGGAGWGGHSNGMIPQNQLCGLNGQSTAHLLRCDAAAAWNAMARAYKRKFRSPMCITDSYRPYAAQVTLYKTKPSMAAVPGTSNHGWGQAVDLCDGINSFGTPQHKWMVKNAGRFGWKHPSWARQGSKRPEPWHWEFGA